MKNQMPSIDHIQYVCTEKKEKNHDSDTKFGQVGKFNSTRKGK